jgi:hypothetical protein
MHLFLFSIHVVVIRPFRTRSDHFSVLAFHSVGSHVSIHVEDKGYLPFVCDRKRTPREVSVAKPTECGGQTHYQQTSRHYDILAVPSTLRRKAVFRNRSLHFRETCSYSSGTVQSRLPLSKQQQL